MFEVSSNTTKAPDRQGRSSGICLTKSNNCPRLRLSPPRSPMPPMATEIQTAQVDAVRAFNRFYTRRIGVLQEGLLDSTFTLTQGRVLFELAQREPVSARTIGDALGLDPGYLSRILLGFVNTGLVEKTRSAHDGRSFALS